MVSGNPTYLPQMSITLNDSTLQCPIQAKLIDKSLLTADEKSWLNEYHSEIYDKISPLLKEVGDTRALEWLKKECAAI